MNLYNVMKTISRILFFILKKKLTCNYSFFHLRVNGLHNFAFAISIDS